LFTTKGNHFRYKDWAKDKKEVNSVKLDVQEKCDYDGECGKTPSNANRFYYFSPFAHLFLLFILKLNLTSVQHIEFILGVATATNGQCLFYKVVGGWLLGQYMEVDGAFEANWQKIGSLYIMMMREFSNHNKRKGGEKYTKGATYDQRYYIGSVLYIYYKDKSLTERELVMAVWYLLVSLHKVKFSEDKILHVYNELKKLPTIGDVNALVLTQLAAMTGFINPVYALWGHVAKGSATHKFYDRMDNTLLRIRDQSEDKKTEKDEDDLIDVAVANGCMKKCFGFLRKWMKGWELCHAENFPCEVWRMWHHKRKWDYLFLCKVTKKLNNMFDVKRENVSDAYLVMLYKGKFEDMREVFKFLYQQDMIAEDSVNVVRARHFEVEEKSWYKTAAETPDIMPQQQWK
jgi:hypothetical protein